MAGWSLWERGGSAGVSGERNREGGIAGNLCVGYAFQPRLSAELRSNAWTKDPNGVTLTFSVVAAGISFYPGGQGFVLRGGVGLGEVSASASSGSSTVTASESGFGATVGAAYEFRLLRSFAIGPQVDYGYISSHGDNGKGYPRPHASPTCDAPLHPSQCPHDRPSLPPSRAPRELLVGSPRP